MDLSQVPTLETERLWLRLFRESDIDDYAAMNADPEVTHFIGGPWDRGRSWRHLAFLIGHWKLRGCEEIGIQARQILRNNRKAMSSEATAPRSVRGQK